MASAQLHMSFFGGKYANMTRLTYILAYSRAGYGAQDHRQATGVSPPHTSIYIEH